MPMDVLLLDTGPLNQLCFADKNPAQVAIYDRASAGGLLLIVPDVVRYESRRKFVDMRRRHPSHAPDLLDELDRICGAVTMGRTDLSLLDQAAELWADARARGVRTSGDKSIDFDVIIAAHAHRLTTQRRRALVVTSNIDHFKGHRVEAITWADLEARLDAAGL